MNRQSGLTLIELTVTLSVFAILCSLTIPNMISWRSRARMNDAAMKMLSVFQSARMLAVRENAPVWVYVDVDDDSYHAFVDNGSGDRRENGVQDDDETVIRGGLPAGVHVDRVTWSPVKFNSRGIPHFGTAVTLMDMGGLQKKVIVSPSGHSRIAF